MTKAAINISITKATGEIENMVLSKSLRPPLIFLFFAFKVPNFLIFCKCLEQ